MNNPIDLAVPRGEEETHGVRRDVEADRDDDDQYQEQDGEDQHNNQSR